MNYRRAPVLIIWTVLLSAITAILGAAPLRVLRQLTGSNAFWFIGTTLVAASVAAKWYPLAVILGAHVILVGVFSEFEDREFTLRQSAFFSVILTALLGFSSFYAWTVVAGKGWLAQMVEAINPLVEKAKSMNVELLKDLKAQDIIAQLPSAVVVFLIMSLALALIFERRLGRWATVRARKTEKLTDFATPDFFIWCFIFSLLGAFAQTGMKTLEFAAINVFNVAIVVYFFQGLAVLGKYFDTFQVSAFWRFLWIMLVVVQLPILMSLLGVVDYWANFRKAFVKKAAQMKKKSIRD